MRKVRLINMSNPLVEVLGFLFCLLGASIGSAEDRVRTGWAAMTASHTPL
jgi:hypothetical protein